MATVTAARIIIPVNTNADKADKSLKSLDKTLKGTTSSVDKYNISSKKNQKTQQNLEKQLKSISDGAKLFGDKTGGAAKQQDLLKKKIQGLLDKGVSPNNKGVQNLKKQYSALDNQLSKSKKGFSSFTKVVGVGAAVALGVKLVQGIKNSVKAGSDLLETQNKFIVTFKGVEKEAEKQAQILQNSYGQSEKGAKALLSSTGDLLTGFGFTSKAALDVSATVQQLSTDIASFQNIEGGTARVSEIVTKALLGERDALVSIGAKILDTDLKTRLAAKGMDKLTGTARLQAQAQETLAMITEQSKNSLGDFINTSNSYANVARRVEKRTEDLSARIGSKLAPAFAKVGVSILSATEKGSAFDNFITGFINDLDLAIQQIANLINIMSLGANKIGEALNVEEMDTLNKRMEILMEQAKELGGAGGLKEFASQLSMGSADAVALNIEIEKIRNAINDLADDNINKNKINAKLIDEITGKSKENAEAAKENNKQQKNLTTNTEKSAKASKEMAEAYREAISILAGTGALDFQLKEQEMQFQEQIATVRKAGLDIAALEKFQTKQREQLYNKFFEDIANNQKLSIDEREAALQAGLSKALDLEKTTADDRLAIQKSFTEQSAKLNQQWFQELADGFEKYSVFATTSIGIGENVAEFFNNQALQEIENLRAVDAERTENAEKQEAALEKQLEDLKEAGATREEIQNAEIALENAKTANSEAKATRDKEIADKDLELRKKQAKQQRLFGIFSTVVDTAIAVTKTLASLPFPANTIAAGLILAEGIAQTAAIYATPIPGAQFGGEFSVPPGAPADTGLLRVGQGEDVSVTPTRDSGGGQGKKAILQIGNREFEGFFVDELNRNLNNGKAQIRRGRVVKTA